jgi:ribose transport system substrate-binding protein
MSDTLELIRVHLDALAFLISPCYTGSACVLRSRPPQGRTAVKRYRQYRVDTRLTLCAILTLTFSAALTFSVGSSSAGSPNRAASSSGQNLLIGASSPIASNPSQVAITRGELAVAKGYGWRIKTLDANLSPGKQVSDIDTLTALNVAGIVTWTIDPGAVSVAYNRARAKGIPIVDFGSTGPLINTSIETQWAHDCSVAERAATYIVGRVGKNAKVLVIGGPPAPVIVFYTKCFVRAAKARGLVVAAEQDNVKDTAATAQPIVAALLTQHPDAAAIWAYNDPTALGAGAVVRSAGKKVWMEGKQKGIIIIGSNATDDAIAGIKTGVMTGTFDPQTDKMGQVAIEALAVHLRDGKPLSAMPKLVVIPTTFWTLSNIAGYVSPLKRKIAVGAIPKTWIKAK